MASKATRQEGIREAIRRFMIRGNPAGPVTLPVVGMSERLNQPVAAVRAALQSLAAEQGRGVRQVSGDIFEYRPVERARKKTDTQVRIKIARYMTEQTRPGSLHMVQDVARACGTLAASTSAALLALSRDPYLYIVRVGYGTYSYRPPGTPHTADPGQNGTSLQPEPEPAPVVAVDTGRYPTPADMPQRRPGEEVHLTPREVEQVVDAREEEPRPTPLLDKLLSEPATEEPRPGRTLLVREPFGPERELNPGEIPEGWLRIVHVTGKGTRLAEDHNGTLHKVIPIEGE